ncbi:ankyrin repeat domain-containing protein [Wolbachia endosymbiont of Folsomia candida]|uniref:ankyrin repeat domain-containing protein n=1 Tax=Wolbachia endosymbiont of Folsomia candida TaxID=169402 RepID=UPI000A9031B6|nr:ankyrin repeat domain-containing protein [Wolbachia endosymbiont of Folsomia candida]
MVVNRNNRLQNSNNQRVQQPLNEQTEKLFRAIDDENLEDFRQALEQGADVNGVGGGYTPLMAIINNVSGGAQREKECHSMIKLLLLHDGIEINACEDTNRNTALHLAMCFQQKKVVQLLLSHPNINTSLTNIDYRSPEVFAKQHRAAHLVPEIRKAQIGKELLEALSDKNITQAKTLLYQEFNPNCWNRNQAGEIETPLSLVIKSCLQGITQDKKEILIKLLKHKELDFSQMKPMPEVHGNQELKQIIDQAMKERLIDAIVNSDLDRKKELVEDNCFVSCAVVIAAFNEGLARVKRDLEGRNSEILNQQTRLNYLIREKKQFLKASTESTRKGNYASIFFVLSGVSAVGACLSMLQMAVCISFISVAFIFLATGCYYSYKANTALEDVTSNQFIGNAANISA